MTNLDTFTLCLNIMKAGGKIRFSKTPEFYVSIDEEKGLYSETPFGRKLMDNALFNGMFRMASSCYKDIIGMDVFSLLKTVSIKENVALFVTTNGDVKQDGSAVMGRGIAKQAVDEFGINIAVVLGRYLKQYGNRVFNLGTYIIGVNSVTVFSFPTKYHWREDSDLTLITKSTEQAKQVINKFGCNTAFLPCPGINNGNLNVNTVRPVLDLQLDSRFFVCFK